MSSPTGGRDTHRSIRRRPRPSFANGEVVVYATFINEADQLTTYSPLNATLDCIVVEVAREYSGQTTGAVLPQCK